MLKDSAQDLDDTMLCLLSTIHEVGVAARNGYKLNADELSGAHEALCVAHDAVDSVKQQRARIESAVQAVEKQLAKIEYRLAEGCALVAIAEHMTATQENE